MSEVNKSGSVHRTVYFGCRGLLRSSRSRLTSVINMEWSVDRQNRGDGPPNSDYRQEWKTVILLIRRECFVRSAEAQIDGN